MAVYPIKMMKDESGQPFVPLTSLDAVIGEKNLQYILDAEELSAGHFRVNFKDLEMKDITNSIIVVRWPQITSTVKPSYLKLNNNTEAILYDGTGKEYMDLEDASGTINLLAYDGTKWIQATGSGSGGGHVITDGEGHSMEQQKVLSFVGFNVENDAANRATKIVNPTPINNLTTTESGQGSLDAYQGNILSKRSVPTGGAKGQVLAKSGNGDHQLEWINQDSDDVVTSDGSIEEIIGLTYEEYKMLESRGELKSTTQYHITDLSDGDISFISSDDIQAMIDDSKEPVMIAENTDLNSIVEPGYYISEKTAVTSTLQNTPPGLTIGFALKVFRDAGMGVSNYYQIAVRDSMMFSRFTNDGGTTWSQWQIMAQYQIGDICITSTNTNPGSRYGGTWTLIGKDLSYKYVNEAEGNVHFTPNTDVITSYDLRAARQGDCIKFRLYLAFAVDIDDNTFTLGTFNWEALGLVNIRFAMFGTSMLCDGGNGMLNCYLNTSGVLESRDIINKYANTVMAAGSAGYLSMTISCTDDEKLDSACDKFYWKRTA